MSEKIIEEVYKMPEFQELSARRGRIIWPLTILTMAVYYGFILLIAFMPEILATPVGDGPVSWGLVSGFGVILYTFLVTGYYVHKANRELEPLTEAIHAKAKSLESTEENIEDTLAGEKAGKEDKS